MGLLNFGEMG